MPTDSASPPNNGNGRRFLGWLTQVPLPVWGFLIVQFGGLVIWAIRLDGRVQANETHIQTLSHEGSIKTNVNAQAIMALTERLKVVEQRQEQAQEWIRKLNVLDQRMDALANRTDRIVSLIDNMYHTQQEMLRRLDKQPPQ